MSKTHNRRVAGSGIAHPVGTVPVGAVERELPLQVTLVLRPRNSRAHAKPPAIHPALRSIASRDDLAAHYDPGNDRVRLVRRFARGQSLSVVEVSQARHDVVLAGTAEQFARSFGVHLQYFETAGQRYYAHDERVRVPRDVRNAVEGVLGLDSIPAHRTHAGMARRSSSTDIPALERHYAFPVADASAHRIALLEFSGGFAESDIGVYARRVGLARPPRVTAVSVPGATGKPATNVPFDPTRGAAIAREWKATASIGALMKKFGAELPAFMASMEVTMDIELALALGGGAAVDVYFAPSGVDGWRRALYATIGLPVGGADTTHPPAPTALSVSWGESEDVFGPAQLRVIDRALIAVQRAGVAVCCASGDWGSLNCPPKIGVALRPNVNFPASSPSVMACGGTRLLAGRNGALREVAWDERVLGVTMATGGGMSGFFARPGAQRDVKLRPAKATWRAPGRARVAGRALPDVAANAAWSSGSVVTFAGADLVGFGTSAATPICAALLTRVSAAVGHPVPGIEGWLYSPDGRACCRAVTEGDNDVAHGAVAFYRAGPGWNACTGLGTLDGERLVAALVATRGSTRRPLRARPSA